MTISESIVTWLKTNTSISIMSDIETDLLQANNESMGLYKAPENIIVEYVDGSKLVTEYYMFLARQSSQLDSDRISNQQFLSNLEEWVDGKNFKKEFPTLVTKYSCENISISSTYYMQEQDEQESIYQLSIEISYLKDI